MSELLSERTTASPTIFNTISIKSLFRYEEKHTLTYTQTHTQTHVVVGAN